jgi:hypothetical protein
MGSHRTRETKGGAGFSVAIYAGNYRNVPNVLGLSVATFDQDHGDREKVERTERLIREAGIAGVVSSTFSHLPSIPKLRTGLAVSRPVTRDEWPRVYSALNAQLEIHSDDKSKDAARFWFYPTVRPGHVAEFRQLEGNAIDVDALLATLPAAPPVRRQATTGEEWIEVFGSLAEGNRDAGLTRLAGAYFRGLSSPRLAEATLHAVNRAFCRPPLPDDQVAKIARSIARSEYSR